MTLAAPTLFCEKRELATKGYLNRLKQEQKIPAIVYGKDKTPIPIIVGAPEITRIFKSHGVRGIFSLNIADESKPLMSIVRDWQKNPLTSQIIHIDFLVINMAESFKSSVPVYVIGEEEAAKGGGIIQSGLKEIEVECLPQDLPENIICDVSNLDMGNNITVSDLQSPPGVVFLSDPDMVVISILHPSKAASDEEEVEEVLETNEGEAPVQE